MKWGEFENRITPEPQFKTLIKTSIECPKCGKNLYLRTDIILTSFPEKYQYECTECGFVGYSHAKWQKGR